MGTYNKLPLTDKGEMIDLSFNPIKGPRNLIITSFPKSGKTLSFANVAGMLIGDMEEGAINYDIKNRVDLRTQNSKENPKKFEILKNDTYIPMGIYKTVEELYKANDMKTFWELQNSFDLSTTKKEKEEKGKKIIEHINKMPFPIFVIDTITSIQDWNNDASLAYYNSIVSIENRKKDIKKVDNYGGVRYTRRNFRLMKDFIEKHAAPYIIWSGHTGERKKILEKGSQEISVADIALEGLQSTLFTAHSDANAILYFDNKEGIILDFEKKEETDFGTRIPHLANKQIKIADILTNEEIENKKTPKTYWNIIYPEIEKLKK